MRTILDDLRAIFVSLKLTVALIALSIVLVLAATLDQVNIGVWAVQTKYFHCWAVFLPVGGFSVAVFPGGYTLGSLLLVNLIAAHLFRFKLAWRKSGIYLVHTGLILLLASELFTGLLQQEYYLRINEGETKNYAESYRSVELAFVDHTDPRSDGVTAIPEALLADRITAQHPSLPFRVVVKSYFANSLLHTRASAPNAIGASASQGVGAQLLATAQPVTFKQDEQNRPSALIELIDADGSIGTWLVSTLLLEPQYFEHAGRRFHLSLRFARHYYPFSLRLLKFSHDRYPGTEIPKNFSSLVRLTGDSDADGRDILISMNNPLRHGGLAFYQGGFENNDTTSILQVVRNPSWLLPYFACAAIALGLLIQFGIHLVGFVVQRSAREARPAHRPHPTPDDSAPRFRTSHGVTTYIPLAVLGLALFAVAFSFRAPRTETGFDLAGFSHLPTLVNGRIKPLDTVARTSLLVLQGRQAVATPDARQLSPAEWLLDVLYRPEVANTHQVFEIVHPEVLTLLQLTPEEGAGKKRFSYVQMSPGLPELQRQSKLAEDVDSSARTSFQRAVIKLRLSLILYQRLQYSVAPPSGASLEDFASFEHFVPAGLAAIQARRAGEPHDEATFKTMRGLSETVATMEAFGHLLLIPPLEDQSDPARWRNPGASLRESLTTRQLNPAMKTYIDLGLAWRHRDIAAFNRTLHEYRASLDEQIAPIMRRCDIESRFNAAQPFHTSAVLYVVAFLTAVISWLRWPDTLGRSAFWLVALAFALTTVGIGIRMWLEGRPPVTNLYSSALFVGWAAVGLCLTLETIYRNAIGSVAAGLIGFATLLIAHHLSLGGDTLEMMRAVLDSNFWLATHVVTIAIGYSATFLAGFLGLIYVARGLLTKSLNPPTAAALTRMVYGIVCFATLFSFVGTVLGGIWADQSWGRFWGWDPKENGALIIVLWNSLILHARWGGLIKARGLMALAIFGNIVTAWSWFGVNMLGVGLHSYGFMDAAFWWLLTFMIAQLLVILVAATPLTKWRSFRP